MSRFANDLNLIFRSLLFHILELCMCFGVNDLFEKF